MFYAQAENNLRGQRKPFEGQISFATVMNAVLAKNLSKPFIICLL